MTEAEGQETSGGGPESVGADSGPPLTLVLLAAGLGSRFGGLKQLEQIGPGGATLMDYALFDAYRAGFSRAVFVIRPEITEAFEASIGQRYRSRLEIATAFQRLEDLPGGLTPPAGRTKPWGTTQAVLAAQEAVGGPFAVLNADDFYGRAALASVAAFLRRTPDDAGRHAVVGYQLDQTASPAGGVNRALLRLRPDGTVARIVETTELVRQPDGSFAGLTEGQPTSCRADALVSMNLWGFFPAIFPVLTDGFVRFLSRAPEARTEYYLPEAIQEAISASRIHVEVLPAGGRWCGVTYAEDRGWVREILDGLVASGEYPEVLWP